MIEALFLLLGLLVGAFGTWWILHLATEVVNDTLAGYRSDLRDALDRIQAPDLDAYKAATYAPLPAPEHPGFLYDPTGLIEAEVEPVDDDR